MDVDALRQSIENASFASAGLALIAGLLFSFNPVALAAIPVSLAYVTRARERHTALAYGAMFILGMVATHVVLGIAAGFGGQWVQGVLGRYWGLVLGPILVLLGLMWAGWLRLPLPAASFRAKRATGLWGAFALGAPFSVAICPVCTPALLVMLGVVAGLGSPALGAAVLFAFALGRAVPIAIGAFAVGALKSRPALGRFTRAMDIAGGVILIAFGLYLLNAYFFVVPSLAG